MASNPRAILNPQILIQEAGCILINSSVFWSYIFKSEEKNRKYQNASDVVKASVP